MQLKCLIRILNFKVRGKRKSCEGHTRLFFHKNVPEIQVDFKNNEIRVIYILKQNYFLKSHSENKLKK